jgi:hypothetical protein
MNPILNGWTLPSRPAQPRPPGAAVTRLDLKGEITVGNSISLFHAIRAASADGLELEMGLSLRSTAAAATRSAPWRSMSC